MQTRILPTKAHAALDYAGAPLLAAAPSLLRLDARSPAAIAPRVTGLGGAALSAVSNHDLAVRRMVPMRAHLLADAAMGAAVAAVPWLTGSARRGARYWLPHALLGATDVALALTTRAKPRSRKERLLSRLQGAPRPALLAVPVVVLLAVGGVAARRRRRGGEDAAAEE